MDNKPKIVFFGTPEFSVKILEAMNSASFMPELIITAPDKPKGRKMQMTSSPVKSWLMKHEARNIKILQPNKLKENESFRLHVSSFKPDLFVVASYGKILPKEILEIPKHGTLNVHPSLLPKLRGASPIQSAILNNEKETGVTIMLMDENMDKGDIVAISNLKSQISNLTYKKLENELANLGGKLLIETIPKWLNNEIKPREQNHNQATYTKLITKKDGEINWTEKPEVIERKIRALNPWPSTYTFHKGRRIIITKARLNKQDSPADKAGELKILRIKPEGKNEMNFQEFLKNNPGFLLEKSKKRS